MEIIRCLKCQKIISKKGKNQLCIHCFNLFRVPLKHSEETKKRLSISRIGEKNPAWKGNNVKYGSLHDWIKWHKSKSDVCQLCGKPSKVLDLANISQKYLRSLDDWEWLCRRCHMKKDGRLERFMKIAKISGEKRWNSAKNLNRG